MAGGAAATLREEERRKTQPLRRRACNRRGSSLAAYVVDLSWIDFKKLRRIGATTPSTALRLLRGPPSALELLPVAHHGTRLAIRVRRKSATPPPARQGLDGDRDVLDESRSIRNNKC